MTQDRDALFSPLVFDKDLWAEAEEIGKQLRSAWAYESQVETILPMFGLIEARLKRIEAKLKEMEK